LSWGTFSCRVSSVIRYVELRWKVKSSQTWGSRFR